MKLTGKRVRLLTVSVSVPSGSTVDDVKKSASDIIREKLGFAHFEIVNVGEADDSHSADSSRYQVAFRKLRGEVVYVHPDYNKIFSQVT